jgi:hypothetical protein
MMKLLPNLRSVYFFGYGADREPEMIRAITGRKPRVIGQALLYDYELRVQGLDEVTARGLNPQKILRNAWGDSFRSYVIVPSPGAVVSGTLFKISLHNRHLVDEWELIELGWYDKAFISVKTVNSGREYQAETQVLGSGQHASRQADGLLYKSWLQPKQRFISIALENNGAHREGSASV